MYRDDMASMGAQSTGSVIAVVGASGRTGQRVVTELTARGYGVRALMRSPAAASARSPGVEYVKADVLDPSGLGDCLMGCSAVVSALGVGSSRTPTTVYSHGITAIHAAMTAAGVRRISTISAAPVGPRAEQPFLDRRLAMPILDRIFGATYQDMARMESLLAGTDLQFVCLRPPRLVDRPAKGHYRLGIGSPPDHGRRITCSDLATALIDVLDSPGLARRAIYVSN